MIKSAIKNTLNNGISIYLSARRKYFKNRNILFFGYSPMNYIMFKPLHKYIERVSNVKIKFSFKTESKNYDEYIQLGIDPGNIVPWEKSINTIWDSIIMADFGSGIFRWRSNFIQICHGVAAKSFIYTDKKGSIVKGDYRLNDELNEYDYVFFPNPTVYNIAKQGGKLKNEKSGFIVGMCCLDDLSEKLSKDQIYQKKKKYIPDIYLEKDVILYAPTWDESASFRRKGDEILDALSEKDAFIFIKPHPNCLKENVGKSNKKIENYIKDVFVKNNYKLITGDPYEIMSISDVMISDFSSISFEYALLKKPIYLFVGENIEDKISDHEQYDLLVKYSYTFKESDIIGKNIFNNIKIDGQRMECASEIQDKWFSNFGTATKTAVNILVENNIINLR